MGQVRESVKTPDSPKKRTHKTQSVCASNAMTLLKAISQLKESGKEAHLRVKKTRKCYAGHVKQGREWLEEHFLTKTDPDELLTPNVDEDPYEDPKFPNVFDCIPNKISDKGLALFLTYKGFHQNLSQGTVEGICATFKDLWDNA